MTCPRAIENGHGPGSPFLLGTTEPEDGTCGYCGSFSGEQFLAMVEAGAELGPTDKNYKVYLQGDHVLPHRGAAKFYFQHLSVEQRQRFIDLLNEKRVKIGMPGYFYTTPFFLTYSRPSEVA